MHAGLHAQAALKAQRDGFQRRVARPLAEAEDRRIHAGGPGAYRRQRIGGGHAQIVMGVHFDFAGPDFAQGRDLRRGGEGSSRPTVSA
jgi:hypothetical protein